jgi:hypothetical protein
MADFNIPAGTTQTTANLTGVGNTVEGNSTAAYGVGGGTLTVTGDISGAGVTVTGGILALQHDANGAAITLNNANLDMSAGHTWDGASITFGTGVSGATAPPGDAANSTLGGVTFHGMANGDFISTGSSSPITNVSYNSATSTLFFTQGGVSYTISTTLAPGQTPNFSAQTLDGHMVVGQGTVICFAAGTLIRTTRGEVAVEDLQIGDLVVTSSGEQRPVKWLGHRTFDFRVASKTDPALPVRVVADAFGPCRPSQDLYLSGGHSVCLDLLGEVFIPVGCLVNGATIARVEVDEITYWHVELDSHDVIFANAMPAESYLAMRNRAGFEETTDLLSSISEGTGRTHADFCRPVVTEGPVFNFVRERVRARAVELGWTALRDHNLHLVVDGRIVSPLLEPGAATFLFPADVRNVRLMSNTFEPAQFASRDRRSLGILLAGLSFCGSTDGEIRRISVDDQRLRDGVYGVENHRGVLRRWTNGELTVDPRLWSGLRGPVALRITYDDTTLRGWTAPPEPRRESRPADRPKLYAVR